MPPAQPDSTYTRESVQRHLNTLIIGKQIDLRPQVNSTNDLAREAGRKGAPEGLVILADEQVRGRGRLGRTWTAPPGSSILCSVLLRPRFSPQQAFYLTIAASLAILRGIRSCEASTNAPTSPLLPRIKWPNDVLLNGRKVSGVLCESEFSGGDWAFAVVGFGINVNLPRESFGDLRDRATSVSSELGHEISRATLLARVLEELEACYFAMQNGQFNSIYTEWASSLETLGRQVSVDYGHEQITGQALRVERDGSLVIKTPDGIERSVLAGDVT
jgi:BirA family transcriptional regulator, biotin operon repressor / biotin---[acetyl-CoA-carboxylase] ligase